LTEKRRLKGKILSRRGITHGLAKGGKRGNFRRDKYLPSEFPTHEQGGFKGTKNLVPGKPF